MGRAAFATVFICTAHGLSLQPALRTKGASDYADRTDAVVKQGSQICVDGHVVPRLFVLGAQKAATTTMANDWKDVIDRPLYNSWSRRLCGANENDICKKETQYFNLLYTARNRSRYATLYAKCEETTHPVAADFTPDYFPNKKVPERIAEFYGSEKDSLVFVVSLRDPLQRMQSAFYDGVREGWCCKETREDGTKYMPTFREHTEHLLEAISDSAGVPFFTQLGNAFQSRGGAEVQKLFRRHRTAYQSLYYFNLLPWLEQFDAAQFVIFPGQEYTAHRTDFSENPVMIAINDKLSSHEKSASNHEPAQIRPAVVDPQARKRNVGRHPKVSDDLSEEEISTLERKVFQSANVQLAQLLADKQSEGLTLAGYQGEKGDSEAILKWLQRGWTL